MSIVKFTETIFSSQGKEGILPPPDADGYHTLILGGLNCFNSAGEYYVAEGVTEMFHESSHFMRRIKSGSLYSEVGHPRREPGMTYSQFYSRIIDIDDKNICAHIGEVTLDFEFGRKNPWLNNAEFIAIIGKVKPAGPKASTLQVSLENRKQNTAFSVRGLTENKERNKRTERKLTTIITFDHVTEPGIAAACKARNPALESFQLVDTSDTFVDRVILKEAIEQLQSNPEFATENNKVMYQSILKSIQVQSNSSRLPKW